MTIFKQVKVLSVPNIGCSSGKYYCCCFDDCILLNNDETPENMIQCCEKKCYNWIHRRCNRIPLEQIGRKLHYLCMSCSRVGNKFEMTLVNKNKVCILKLFLLTIFFFFS